VPDPLTIVYFGTSAFAVPALEAAAASDATVVAVYTQPPRPAGRGHKLKKTPVHEAAERLGLEVRTPRSLRDAAVQAEVAGLEADLGLVAAYGLILPRPVLDAPRLGCINLHASILPRWRGAAPIQRALEAGDATTGVTIFQMEEGLDTGPVLLEQSLDIAPDESAATLEAQLAALAAAMVPDLLDGLRRGVLEPRPQPEDGACYARKVEKSEGEIDFSAPAALIERRLRAFDPWPGCWCGVAGARLRLIRGAVVEGEGAPGEVIALPLTIACGEKALEVRLVQRQGRRPMPAEDLQRGFAIPLGVRLG